MRALYDFFMNASIGGLIGGLILAAIIIRFIYEILRDK